MEGGGDHDQNVGNGGAGARWNPTKEQINMLEGLYKQGLRTPSAEQIQQITSRLKAFGHIEGKNVFYWFQNHKARQRQKQKQDNLASYFTNRFLHPSSAAAPPVLSPYHHNVCSPYYMAQAANNELGMFHHHQQQQYPKVPLPAAASGGGLKRSKLIIPAAPDHQNYTKFVQLSPRASNPGFVPDHDHHQETLDLFPIHPTGIKNGGLGDQNENICYGTTSDDDGHDDKHPFFDFFCGN